MPTLPNWLRQAIQITHSLLTLAAQVLHRIRLRLRSRTARAAAHLFLQQQVVLYSRAQRHMAM